MSAHLENNLELQPLLKVVIVEDDEWIRDYLVREINHYPRMRCVNFYGTAEDALKGVPVDQPDVVLMDINLPGMDGIECLRRLRLAMPQLCCLILTNYEDGERVFQALLAGACGYLLKRYSAARLMESIWQARAGGVFMSCNVARNMLNHFKQLPPGKFEPTALSGRERQVLELLAQGWSGPEITKRLSLSFETIFMDVRHIYAKLHGQFHDNSGKDASVTILNLSRLMVREPVSSLRT